MYPGWEIFFNEKLTFKEKPTVVIKETMLKMEGDMFVITNEEPSDLFAFIMHVMGQLNNWI